MSFVKLEAAIGVINGSNKEFSTSMGYAPGSLEVYVNGLILRRQDDDGWTETGDFTYELKEAPQLGDTVSHYYRI